MFFLEILIFPSRNGIVKKYFFFRYKKQSKCKGRLIYKKNQNTFKETGNHLHAPDGRIKKKCKLLNALKEKANTDHRKSRALVGEASALANVAEKPLLPSCTQMMRSVQRQRKKYRTPPNPGNLNDLKLPEEYTKSLDNKEFLLFDSGPGDSRLLIFSTEENLNELAKCTSIHMDGTFTVAPLLFTQLYTIHGGNLFLYRLIHFDFAVFILIVFFLYSFLLHRQNQ